MKGWGLVDLIFRMCKLTVDTYVLRDTSSTVQANVDYETVFAKEDGISVLLSDKSRSYITNTYETNGYCNVGYSYLSL